jgi:hypothetical protein
MFLHNVTTKKCKTQFQVNFYKEFSGDKRGNTGTIEVPYAMFL